MSSPLSDAEPNPAAKPMHPSSAFGLAEQVEFH
jgi:hypothetical protein